ncbi:MAG: aldo/keto reductase [Bdellovibrionaceae bacterium]|nr:aldo/keto reductase [Pseudobdellovibrionaceae bacterium]
MGHTRRDFLKTAIVMGVASHLPAIAAPSPVHEVVLPGTKESVLRVGLGTFRVFDVGNDANKRTELKKVLKAFHAAGGRLIDTSPMYGSAEKVLGELSTELGLNDKFVVATKVWTHGAKEGRQQIDASFKLIKRQKLDLFQIHNLMDWQTQLKTLRKLRDEGKIKYIGITHYMPSAFAELAQVLKTEKMDFLQIPYSLQETSAERELLGVAAEHDVKVIANEPFGQGELFRRMGDQKLPPWAKDYEIETWAQLFLKFILSEPRVHFAIPGTGRLRHVEDNLRAARGPLPEAKDRAKFRALLKI